MVLVSAQASTTGTLARCGAERVLQSLCHSPTPPHCLRIAICETPRRCLTASATEKIPHRERVTGGTVSEECKPAHGSALCFGGPGVRYAITVPVNTVGGAVVRFSLKMESDESGHLVRFFLGPLFCVVSAPLPYPRTSFKCLSYAARPQPRRAGAHLARVQGRGERVEVPGALREEFLPPSRPLQPERGLAGACVRSVDGRALQNPRITTTGHTHSLYAVTPL